MRKCICTVLSVTLLILGIAACAQSAEKTAMGIPVQGYRLIWSDKFNGNELGLTKWGYRNLGPRRDAVNVKDMNSIAARDRMAIIAPDWTGRMSVPAGNRLKE